MRVMHHLYDGIGLPEWLIAFSLRSIRGVEVRQVHSDGHEGFGQGGVGAVAVVGRLGPAFSGEGSNLVVLGVWCQLSNGALVSCLFFEKWGCFPILPTCEKFDHCETGESDYCLRSFRKMPYRRATDTEPMDRILL